MNNITIGIPESMFYYNYKHLLTNFFKELNINIILGKSNNIIKPNMCYPLNIFFSGIDYLKDKVNYILIINDETNISCPYYKSLYDISNNYYSNRFLYINVNNKRTIEDELMNLGKKLGYSGSKLYDAYKSAFMNDYKHKRINYLIQEKKLNKDSKKILIIGNNYLLDDDNIKNKLNNLIKDKNIDIIYSNIMNPSIKIHQNNQKIDYFNNINRLKSIVDKTVYISTKPCVFKNDKKDIIFIEKIGDDFKKMVCDYE